MKLFEFADIISVNDISRDVEIKDITKNSELTKKGVLYFCTEKDEQKAEIFAESALRKGAAAVVSAHKLPYEGCIESENPRQSYAKCCMRYFGNPEKNLKLIAVTGTNGKTTVSYIISGVLEALGEKCSVIGTIKNIIGGKSYDTELTTPDAKDIAMLLSKAVDEGCGYCVIEASSHALSQYRLDGCEFETGIFTNLTVDHLDYHGSMEDYLAAKKRLFDLCKSAVLNLDDSYCDEISWGIKCRYITYSVKSNRADLCARIVKSSPTGVAFDLLYGERLARTSFVIPGTFSVSNCLAAIGALVSIGFDYEQTVPAVKTVKQVKGRMENVETGKDFSVIIDYAHTPDGLQNVLKTVREFSAGRIIVVFGCGGNRDRSKRPIMGKIAGNMADIAVITSDNPRLEPPGDIISDIVEGVISRKNCVIIENREQAIEWAIKNASSGDVVILAGKGHETYQIIGKYKIHFDEREIIKKYIGEIV